MVASVDAAARRPGDRRAAHHRPARPAAGDVPATATTCATPPSRRAGRPASSPTFAVEGGEMDAVLGFVEAGLGVGAGARHGGGPPAAGCGSPRWPRPACAGRSRWPTAATSCPPTPAGSCAGYCWTTSSRRSTSQAGELPCPRGRARAPWVAALPGVRIVAGCEVEGLTTTVDRGRVTGVRLRPRERGPDHRRRRPRRGRRRPGHPQPGVAGRAGLPAGAGGAGQEWASPTSPAPTGGSRTTWRGCSAR